MKDLLTRIAQALVDKPEKVQVNEIKGGQAVVLELKVADTDIGRYHRQTRQNSKCHPGYIKGSFRKSWKKIRS